MKLNTNKIEIPKEVFENIFFARGGQKVPDSQLHKALTGEYQFALDTEQPIAQPNAEIENNEYVFDSQGIRKAKGDTHENGGIPVALEDGTRILSDHLEVGTDVAKKLSEALGIKVKPKDTYAKALDKFTAKSGLKDLNDEMESYIAKVESQQSKTKDENALTLNIEFLGNKINDITQKKAPIEREREGVFNTLFDIQEATKKQEEESKYKMQMGGEIKALAKKYNIDEDRALELMSLAKYQPGGTTAAKGTTGYNPNTLSGLKREHQSKNPQLFGANSDLLKAVQELYNNFPDLVNSSEGLGKYFGVGADGKLQAKEDTKGQFSKINPIIGDLQKKMDTRMRATAQVILDNPTKYGEEAVKGAKDYLEKQTFSNDQIARGFDEKLGNFTSGRFAMKMNLVTPEDLKLLKDSGISTVRQLKGSPVRDKLSKESLASIEEIEKEIGDKDADFRIDQFVLEPAPEKEPEPAQEIAKPGIGDKRTTMSALNLPVRHSNYPTLQPALKVDTRLTRIDPVHISPEVQLAEADRTNQAVLSQMQGNLSGSQAAIAGIGLSATDASNRNKIISDVNRANAAADAQAQAYNARISDLEQQAENQNALNYEERTLRGLGNYENDLNNLFNRQYEEQVNAYKTIGMLNAQNALNPNVQFTGQGYEVRDRPEFSNEDAAYLRGLAEADKKSKEANKKKSSKGAVSTTNTSVARFGGRFRK